MAELSAPSKRLRDPRRERFCQELAAGALLHDAYVRAGFRHPRGNAARVAREPKVVTRLEWLLKRNEPHEETMIAWRRASMRRWLENVRDLDRRCFFQIGDDGQVKLAPLAELDSEQAALIEGIEQTRYGIRINMPSKLQAAAQLARLDGLEAPTKNEHTGTTLEGLVMKSFQIVTGVARSPNDPPLADATSDAALETPVGIGTCGGLSGV